MIKITEKEKDGATQSPLTEKIHVSLENKEEKTFESYPIVIKSKDIKHLTYEIQKATKTKTNTSHTGGLIDKVIEKAKDVKDAVIGTTKDAAGKTKDTASPALSSQSPDSSESSFMDKVKEKAKDAKDAVVDTTKDVAGKTKDSGGSDTSSESGTVVTETTTTETRVEPS